MTAQSRIHDVFVRCGITRDMVQARVRTHHGGGRLPIVKLQDWQYGCATVAAMLELVEESMTKGDDSMSGISIEVTTGDTKTYLPLGAILKAIDAETGEPLDLQVALDRGEIIVHPSEPPVS